MSEVENGKPFEYAWRFMGRRYRAVEYAPGMVRYFRTETDSDGAPFEPTDTPIGLTNELVHLALRLAAAEKVVEAARRLYDLESGFSEQELIAALAAYDAEVKG